MKTIKQAILDKLLYIGEEIPSGVAEDKRPKFVLLGTPQELIDETTEKSVDIGKLKEILGQAFGEISALFMSQEKRGVDIVMPTKELEKIAEETTKKLI
jgi:hypothetical protein